LANPGDHKPVSMLFAGPTGVGKTEATESMARILGLPILSLSMGEFTSKYDTAELKKKISEFATKNYAGVILVDEIEKSDPGVRDLFLNLFDKGSVGSGEDKVDCGFMICVATTNVGARAAVALKQRLRESFGDPKIHDSWTREQMIEAGFRPEFVNRIGLACDFNDIIPADALKIAKLMIAKKSKELKNSRGIDLVVDESVAKEHAADVFDADYGARGIKRCVEDTMNAIVAAQSIALAIGPGCRIEATSVSATITAKVTTSEGVVSEARIAGQDGNAELERLNAVLGGFSAVVKASAAQASISMPKEPTSSASAPAKP
jgi:ATP-dependent Clp protease ATP-binding subunit ClpA